MSETTQLFTARIQYSPNFNNTAGYGGKSDPAFGNATVSCQGLSSSEQIIVPGRAGFFVTFASNPKPGFESIWVSPVTPNRPFTTDANYTFPYLTQDVTLVPVYKPSNVTLGDVNISVTNDGSHIPSVYDINLSSMLGFYSTDITNAGGGTFNTPEGKPITITTKRVNGYKIKYVIAYDGGNTSTIVDKVTNGNGYFTSTTKANDVVTSITVDYESVTPQYTVNVRSNGHGTVSVRVNTNQGDRGESQQNPGRDSDVTSITVDEGTVVELRNAPDAGYKLKEWDDPEDDLYYDEHAFSYTYTVEEDKTFTATFVPIDPVIDVTSNPSNGGSVEIRANGQTVNTPVSYSDVLGNNITITAVASSGYMFSYWRMTSGDASVSDYNSYETTVAFGELNSYIEAVFTPRNTLGINTYTSVLTSELNLMSGERENAFVISYGDSHSIQREVYVGADQVNISTKIDSLGGDHVNLNLKVNVDEYYDISNTYRYRFSHFQYADGRGTPSGVWTTVTPDSHGDCIINVPIAASSITLTAVYVKEEMCTLHLGLRSNNGYYSNIYNDITITATGDYGDYSNPLNPRFPKNTSVTVSEELNDGVDSSRYTFINWKKIIDDTETTDSNVTLSFTIMGSISVIANYTEKCKLTYSLINDSGIGSPEITCTDKTASSTVSTDTWIISGHEVSFTVSDLESGTYVNKWVCNDSSIDPDPEDPNYTNSLTFKIWQDSDVFAVIGTTPKTLTITISGNGSVSVDEIISTNYISIEPNVGTNTYSIGQGHGVRLTATPSTLSKFNQYIITSNGSTEQPTSAEYTIGDVQYDIDATAIFSKIPWIQSLGTIIKVF